MTEMKTTADCNKVYGTPHVCGAASGELLASNLELSFWGGVDQFTGQIVDRYHPLCHTYLKNKILAIPGGRGSCSGSATILELIMNDNGPKALVFERVNDILAVGVFVAEELFGKTIPLMVVSHEDFQRILGWNGKQVHIQDRCIIESPTKPIDDILSSTTSLRNCLQEPWLSDNDTVMLRGGYDNLSSYNKAQALAMKIIVRTASIMKAPSLMSVTQAHVDGAHFGPASVLFGRRLRDLGGIFAVPTTVNALTIDRQRWRDLGVDVDFGTDSDELARAYLAMGAKMSFTCAPYQLDAPPTVGDQVAFGESNVVCFANSVLGARTAKYPNMLETLIALTGRAPKAGVHLPENRIPKIWIVAPPLSQLCDTNLDDSFWPLLGYEVGSIAASRIPIITGLENMPRKPSIDDLKAFSAAFATSAGAPMFHMAGITPEAESYERSSVSLLNSKITITWRNLETRWTKFNQTSDSKIAPRTVDLVSLGNPHFSLLELKKLSQLCQGRMKDPSTSVIVTTSRVQHSLATQAGYLAQLETFGVEVLTDTCWCFIRDPVIRKNVKCIMTNSGKYAHYGPGLTGRDFCFGDLKTCVEVACTGTWTNEMPAWMQTGVRNC